MIVQVMHKAMERQDGFNLDIDIKNWDKHQSNLEWVVKDKCFYVEGTDLALDSEEWQYDLDLISAWFNHVLDAPSFKALQALLNERWAKYTKIEDIE